jgi:hypothetical protein
MVASDSTNLIIGIGGPLSSALIIALVAWVIRLVGERRKKEIAEHDNMATTVSTLTESVRQITLSLGGTPATAFQGQQFGLLDAVSHLTKQVASLTTVVNGHTDELRVLKGSKP